MLIQHGFGDPGRFGDVVHRRGVIAAIGENRERDVEQLSAAAGSGKTGRHGGNFREESPTIMANSTLVRPARQVPPKTTRRPPEPFRPLPARKMGVSLLATQARRRRYRGTLPPRAGHSGW
jgi:hypothetical protein